VWTGFIWVRIRTSGGLLWTRQRTFGCHEVGGEISWLAERLLASQFGLIREVISVIISLRNVFQTWKKVLLEGVGSGVRGWGVLNEQKQSPDAVQLQTKLLVVLVFRVNDPLLSLTELLAVLCLYSNRQISISVFRLLPKVTRTKFTSSSCITSLFISSSCRNAETSSSILAPTTAWVANRVYHKLIHVLC
jgi:hypothetical protein